MRWTTAALILILMMSVASLAANVNTMTALNQIGANTEVREMAQIAETTWTDEEGLTHTVKTPRQDGETKEAWAARHKENVDALKELFPPAG